MPRLYLVGELDDTRPLLDLLPQGDFSVTLASEAENLSEVISSGPHTLILAVLRNHVPAVLDAEQPPDVPWIGWNRFDDVALTALAYRRGALAVLPGSLSAEALEGVLRTAFARAVQPRTPPPSRAPHGPANHQRGGPIGLHEQDVMIVEVGIVATTVLHEDGTEVLVGLCGPGQVVVGHPHDSCCLQLTAHTDVRVLVQSWNHVVATPKFAERLRARLRHQEAWAAVQARPHLADRLIGLLSVLAEQFGRPVEAGSLIEIKLTHTQLASAIGATRATVTRLMGRLRRQRLVHSVGAGQQERLVLHLVERHLHG